jgi:hypothetical protein
VARSEGGFIQLLCTFGLDAEYCHQVVPDFWDWPVDFYSFEADCYVLVDDRHHWTGIHQYNKTDIAELDMALNLAAVDARAKLLRVHAADMLAPTWVPTALAAVRAGAAIVLSPSYADYMIEWQGRAELYAAALQRPGPDGHPRVCATTVEHGICVLNPV